MSAIRGSSLSNLSVQQSRTPFDREAELPIQSKIGPNPSADGKTGLGKNAGAAVSPNPVHAGGHPFLSRLKSMQGDADLSQIRQGKLFATVDSIVAKSSTGLTMDGLRAVLPKAALSYDKQRSNMLLHLHASLPFEITDGYSINRLEAKVDPDDASVKMLTFFLDGVPISPKAIQQKYGELRSHLPVDPAISTLFHAAAQSWGELRFGYEQERPDLLKTICLEMKDS